MAMHLLCNLGCGAGEEKRASRGGCTTSRWCGTAGANTSTSGTTGWTMGARKKCEEPIIFTLPFGATYVVIIPRKIQNF